MAKITARVSPRIVVALCALAFVFVAMLLDPGTSWAQTPDRVYRVGFLGQTSAADMTPQLAALREGLRQLGFDDARNLNLEYRWAERKLDQLPALAAELANSKVDVIVTHGSAGSRSAL